jgi:hypothetical protein
VLTRIPILVTLPALALVSLSGCTLLPVSRAPAAERYAERPSPHAPHEVDRFPNWPVPPHEAERLILHTRHELQNTTGAGAGTTGAEKVVLAFPDDGLVVDFKWKLMDPSWKGITERLDGINNSPRKELAAWKIQQLFLEPEDYVVPFTVAYCVPLADATEKSRKQGPTLDGSQCLLGVAAVWLNDLTLADPLLDPKRFDRDYVYAYFMSNLNLFTYLAKHHDARSGNFLVSKDDARRQAFSIDNGVSFGSGFSGLFYNWFVANWNSIRVPALRKESIDRLRGLKQADVTAALGVVSQLERDDAGIYLNVSPGENLDPGRGVRIEGKQLQFGLTDDEIEDVWERIEDLIEDVDDGDLPVF